MIVIENTDERIVLQSDDGKLKAWFIKHPYLPSAYGNYDLGAGGGNASGLSFCRDALYYVFSETDIIMVYGKIAKPNAASRAFAAALPVIFTSEDDNAWYVKCGIQYFMNKNPGRDYTKANSKRPQ